MRIVVTGGTGLLGKALVELLLAEEHEVRCLVREGSPRARQLDALRVELVRGNADNVSDLKKALSGIDTLLHVAGIEYTPQVLEAARETEVRRVVVIGSTSVHSAYEFR